MPEASQEYVASLSKRLNAANIPCVLWSDCLISVHGVPTGLDVIAYVVPDDNLESAIEAIMPAKTPPPVKSLLPCPDTSSCETTSPHLPRPAPAFHAHIENSYIEIYLYLQSETLWFLPLLHECASPLLTSKGQQYFLLASDQSVLSAGGLGRGCGFFKTELPPVIVPKTHVLLEALIRMHARDWGKGGMHAASILCYIVEYIDERGKLDMNQVPDLIKKFYLEFKHGFSPEHTMRMWSAEVEKAFEPERKRSAILPK